MPFHSPHTFRERLLFYGEPGTGKSRAYLDIAKFHKLTKSTAHFYVIDNDKAAAMMADSLGLDNVTVYEVYEWPEYITALKQIMKVIQPIDFIIADLMSESWTAVQSFYTEQVFGDDIGAYFLQVKKDMAKETEFGGWTDWKYINKLYFDFTRPFVYKSPCHVIGVSSCSGVMRGKPGKVGDSKEVLSIFGVVGQKPEGQKRLPHQFNTVIFFSKNARGEHLITTVKDRERTLQNNLHNENFAVNYLKGVAGWQL